MRGDPAPATPQTTTPDDDEATARELLGAWTLDVSEGPDRRADREELRASVEATLQTLRAAHARAICLRFGLLGAEPHTYAEMARRLGVSRQRAQALTAHALRAIARRCSTLEAA